jgi:hypothetical protein
MATFPKAEAKILGLTRLVIEGLRATPEDFPNLPVSADELQVLLDEVQADVIATAAANAAYHEHHTRKDKSLHQLTRSVKAVLGMAEVMSRRHPERLARLGWGPRRERKPLQAPGEVRDIKLEAQGKTYVLLSWKPPVEGGAVAAYVTQGKREGAPWQDVEVCMETHRIVTHQPRGVELEYRVFARNKTGVGNPSATVTCVL